ncbi:AMP-binding protein [Paenibacillus sp. IB182493]|uniref:AMP-binding protein n=2 Tax=Paenibacillus arenilitoris TaxID=2772299 RepID=A0A927CIH3_9BACL|nr:AMP-binding protein [Paenibacillus arenilitoris]
MYRIGMLSPKGLYGLAAAVYRYGVNPMALLGLAERTHGGKTALTDDRESLSFRQLAAESERLAGLLADNYGIGQGRKVGLMCRNHASLVKSVFAASMTGADLYLLSAEMSAGQLKQLTADYDFDLLIHDAELTPAVEQSAYAKAALLSYHDRLPAVDNLLRAARQTNRPRRRASSGKIMLLTGGTTGKPKKIAHKPSLFNYLQPFGELLSKLKLLHCSTAYIATPIFHGYGIAILLLFVALGKKIVLTSGFEAGRACTLIRRHGVDVVTVVPLMLSKMLKLGAGDLKTLACVASGGAELNPKLAEEALDKLGPVLYNLYGTSEAGLNLVATPQDLAHDARTVGRPIVGTRIRIANADGTEEKAGIAGQICVKNKWSAKGVGGGWIKTGDIGYRDRHGYYYLCGRADDLVVSAGENVYPIEVEQLLIRHPDVEDVAVKGVRDEMFGQRLKAYVQPAELAGLSEEALMDWLRPRAARYQMPREIVFVREIPYTRLGKQDKKQLD